MPDVDKEQDNPGDLDYSKLEALKRRVQQGDNPEFTVKSPIDLVIDIFRKLQQDEDLHSSPRLDEYLEKLELDTHDLQELDRRVRKEGYPLGRVRPGSPYADTEGNELLSIFHPSSINGEPRLPHEKRFYMAEKMLTALGVELPEGKTLEIFLRDVDLETLYLKNTGLFVNRKRVAWTFHTNILGVAMHIDHGLTLPGEPVLSGGTQFTLAFKPGILATTTATPE